MRERVVILSCVSTLVGCGGRYTKTLEGSRERAKSAASFDTPGIQAEMTQMPEAPFREPGYALLACNRRAAALHDCSTGKRRIGSSVVIYAS